MQDLSDLAEDSIWCSSQAAGNMSSSNKETMTAPGSPPVDPVIPASEQGNPTVKLGSQMPAGTSGKPQASGQASYTPEPVKWVPTTIPQVIRGKPVNAPGAEVPR